MADGTDATPPPAPAADALSTKAGELNSVTAPERDVAAATAVDPMVTRALEQLYTRHGGDLAAIFGEINDEAGLAKAQAMATELTDAAVFASRMAAGAFSS